MGSLDPTVDRPLRARCTSLGSSFVGGGSGAELTGEGLGLQGGGDIFVVGRDGLLFGDQPACFGDKQ